jgi:glycosyltransferase involved in cell wall biosynthesis
MSPTRYLYDWKDEYLAENGLNKGLKGLAVKKILSDIRIWDQEASKRPDRYIAISKHVQNRLRKYYRVDSDIVYPPTHVEEFSPHFGLPEDYYIIISRLSAYKKIDLAIEAFNETKDNLIIIGVGEDEKRLKRLANNNIEFLGWQSDEASREYLRYAKALIFPGEEDFGLTPVEAMASGRPVIAYNKGGVTETVRDGKDGVFFDQPTSNSLIEALNRFDMMAKTLNSKEICQQAEKFSFDTFKEQFLKKVNEYAKTC